MARGHFTADVLNQIGRLFGAGTVAGLGERQLLERFVARRDEVAFEALVARHGPMVLGVCRRLLPDRNDADDAFQATFLVLVRRAGSIRDGDRLGPWLYGVAHRVARRIRAHAARRHAREQGGATMAAHAPTHDPAPDDLGPALHEELARLPEKYRAVIVLCDMQGCTHEEAARRLKWPVGTIKGRQSRARELLRARLARRGLAPSVVALTVALAADARAAVPPALLSSTVRAAMSLAAGGAVASAGLASAPALAAAEEVARAMFLFKLKLAAAAVLTSALVVTGAGVLAQHGDDGKPDDRRETPQAKSKAQVEQPRGSAKGEKESPKAQEPEITLDQAWGKMTLAQLALGSRQFEQICEQLEQGTPPRNDLLIAAREAALTIIRVMEEWGNEPIDRVAMMRGHRGRMERLKRLTEQYYEKHSDQGIPSGRKLTTRIFLEYCLAEAELWLAQTRAGKELYPPPGTTTFTETETGQVFIKPTAGTGGLTPGGSQLPPQIDPQTRAILAALDRPMSMPFPNDTPLEDVLKYVRTATEGEELPDGLPIYVDPAGLAETEHTLTSPVAMDLNGVSLKTTLRLILRQVGLNYIVKEGIVFIGNPESLDFMEEAGMTGGGPGGVPGYGIVPPGGFPKTPQDGPGRGGMGDSMPGMTPSTGFMPGMTRGTGGSR